MRKVIFWIVAATLGFGYASSSLSQNTSPKTQGASTTRDVLVGTWRGDLTVTPDTKVIVQFIVEKNAAGGYSARLNAPKEPNLQNIPANAVAFSQGQVSLQVDAVSGVYKGALSDGVIQGTWTQQGTSFPLELRPYVKPVLSQESMRRLVGSWHGKVRPRSMPNGLTLVMRFELSPQNELLAYMDIPDQSLFGLAQQVTLTDDNKFSIKQESLKIEYVADLTSDEMSGAFTQRNIGPLPLTLQRGQYRDESGIVMPAAAKEKLLGPWHGELRGLMTLVLRFTEKRDGSVAVTLDSPDQGVRSLPVRDVKFDQGQLSLAIPGIQAKMQGTVSPKNIIGTYLQGGQTIALTLDKGEYAGNKLQVSSEVTKQLLGKWEGTVGSTRLIFRFERDGRGQAFAYLDVPREKAADLPLTALRTDGDAISFVVKAIPAEFKGQLGANEISGKWTTPNVQAPLVIKRNAGS